MWTETSSTQHRKRNRRGHVTIGLWQTPPTVAGFLRVGHRNNLRSQDLTPQEIHGSGRRQSSDQIPAPSELHRPVRRSDGGGHSHVGRTRPEERVLRTSLGCHCQAQTVAGTAVLQNAFCQGTGHDLRDRSGVARRADRTVLGAPHITPAQHVLRFHRLVQQAAQAAATAPLCHGEGLAAFPHKLQGDGRQVVRGTIQAIYRENSGANASRQTVHQRPHFLLGKPGRKSQFDLVLRRSGAVAQNDILSLWSRLLRQGYTSAPEADFIIHAGDLINRAGRDAEWGEWLLAGGWLEALQVARRDTGNAMDAQDVVELSDGIDIDALRNYRQAVGRATRDIVKKLRAETLAAKVDPVRLQRVSDEGAIVQEAHGIIEYWGKRNIAGLLLMPASRHSLVHLNEAQRLKQRRR